MKNFACGIMKSWGALEYESDRYVPTGEQKHGAFSVGFHRTKGVIGCGNQTNWASLV